MGGKYIIVGEKCKLLAENSICWQSESVKVEGIHFYLSAGIPLQWKENISFHNVCHCCSSHDDY